MCDVMRVVGGMNTRSRSEGDVEEEDAFLAYAERAETGPDQTAQRDAQHEILKSWQRDRDGKPSKRNVSTFSRPVEYNRHLLLLTSKTSVNARQIAKDQKMVPITSLMATS